MGSRVKCRLCGWVGNTDECGFGHDDFYCPHCLKESLEEVNQKEVSMKKLLMYSHLGIKVFEADVFLEGADFTLEYPQPTCIWLGKVMIVDKEPEPQPTLSEELTAAVQTMKDEEEIVATPEELGTEQLEFVPDEATAEEKAVEELAQEQSDKSFQEKAEEVKDEPKAVSNKSPRKSRVSKAKQPKTTKRLHKLSSALSVA